MNSAPVRPGQRILAASRWFAIADVVLAVCSAGLAAALPWIIEPHPFVFFVSLLLLLAAAAFIIAFAALKRGWRGRWLLQIVGPTLILYLLFGLLWALAGSILGAMFGRVGLRWAESRDL